MTLGAQSVTTLKINKTPQLILFNFKLEKGRFK